MTLTTVDPTKMSDDMILEYYFKTCDVELLHALTPCTTAAFRRKVKPQVILNTIVLHGAIVTCTGPIKEQAGLVGFAGGSFDALSWGIRRLGRAQAQ